MDIFSKNRLMMWAVIFLTVLNTVLIVLLWTSREERPVHEGPPPRDRAALNEFIIKELSLDAGQQQQFETLRREHRAQAERLQQDMRPLRDSLFNYGANPGADRVNALTQSIGRKQAELELVTYSHFKSLRDICNDDQKKKFDEIIGDVLRKMAPKPPGR
jgi:Spy/CpxP family protein refolding chaperone